MEQEKSELLATIKQNYTGAHEMNIENSVAFTANIRATLEAAVKLFWKEKLGYIPSWTRGSKEIFITGQAVRSQKFTAFFERWALKEMEYICDVCGDSVHGENMSIDTANELISSLDKSLRAMEKILGFLIIPAIRKEEIKNNTAPQKPIETTPVVEKKSREKVKHARFGDGEIISIKEDTIKVLFGVTIKEFPYPSSINNGTLTLVSAPTFVHSNSAEETMKDRRKTIDKKTAITLCQSNGIKVVWRYCTFSSKNRGAYTYWANPKKELLDTDWWLLLNDTINRKLYVFMIPAHTLSPDVIKVRADSTDLMDVQIQYGDEKFTDIRSKVCFRRWYIREFGY